MVNFKSALSEEQKKKKDLYLKAKDLLAAFSQLSFPCEQNFLHNYPQYKDLSGLHPITIYNGAIDGDIKPGVLKFYSSSFGYHSSKFSVFSSLHFENNDLKIIIERSSIDFSLKNPQRYLFRFCFPINYLEENMSCDLSFVSFKSMALAEEKEDIWLHEKNFYYYQKYLLSMLSILEGYWHSVKNDYQLFLEKKDLELKKTLSLSFFPSKNTSEDLSQKKYYDDLEDF